MKSESDIEYYWIKKTAYESYNKDITANEINNYDKII